MTKLFDIDFLRQTGWLAAAPDAFQDAVLARCDRIAIKAGHSVYHFGDDVGGILGVVEGHIEVHGRAQGEDPTLVFIAGPGFWTGEFATATGDARIISLVAHTDVKLVRLPRAEFLRIAGTYALAWHQLAILATRNSALAMQLIGMLRRTDPVERMSHLLHLLLREVPPPSLTVRASQSDLGAMARMSRTSVNAALGTLETRGLVRPAYRGIEVMDPERLAAIARGD